jgi:hypothetical protein
MSFQLTLYDARNWAHAEFVTGHSMRDCLNHIANSPSPTIVIWDGDGSRKPRQKIFAGYKAKRPPLAEDLRAQFDLLESLATLTTATTIKVDGYEADDVLAHMANEWKVGPVVIYSSDRDLLQIPNVRLDGDNKLKCERRYLRLYKATVGDPSDCIPGIPGFGEKTFNENITPERALNLETWLIGFEDPKEIQLTGELKRLAPKRCHPWLDDIKNVKLIRDYWDIIGFLPLSNRKIDQSTTIGKNRMDVADDILKGLLQ